MGALLGEDVGGAAVGDLLGTCVGGKVGSEVGVDVGFAVGIVGNCVGLRVWNQSVKALLAVPEFSGTPRCFARPFCQ